MPLHTESINPTLFVHNSIQIFHVQAKAREILLELTSDLPTGLTINCLQVMDEDEISCDQFAVAQVIRNFVSNSLKFTPTGGRITIHVYFEQDSSMIGESSPYLLFC
jgi:signal transduction histidine kinase